MKKSKIITIVILIAVIVIAVFFFYQGQNRKLNDQVNVINSNQNEVEKVPEVLGNKADLVSFSIKPNDGLNYPVEATGIVKGGYFFEGNILINILDKDKNLLRAGHGTAITDWMTDGPVSFKTTINVTELPNAYGGLAYIEIHNDNASGLPENDKSILIPVYIM
jgi:hypothetical protein